ncbi:MAG: hypothetical protein IPN70_00305 [Candidatus Moraniibacteriota bacterium]|nr:MAG: hypothetical protein IPN70_00305 [Candidatus Moranbacteria bacterium]
MLSFEQKKILFVSDGLVSFSIALLVGAISILFFKFSWIIFFLSFGLGMALLGGFYENRHIYPYVIFFLSLPFFLLIFSKKTDFSFIEGISGTAFSQEVVISGSSVKENSTQRVPFVFQYCDRGDCF